MIQVVVAAIAALAAVLSAWLSRRTHAEIRTNHGMRAGEHLESISTLADVLATHAAQDAANFETMRQQLAEFEAYQHDRNHDVLNQLAIVKGWVAPRPPTRRRS